MNTSTSEDQLIKCNMVCLYNAEIIPNTNQRRHHVRRDAQCANVCAHHVAQ